MGSLIWFGAVLVVLWLVLWFGFHVVTGLIHLLVIAGILLIAWGLINRGASAVRRRS